MPKRLPYTAETELLAYTEHAECEAQTLLSKLSRDLIYHSPAHTLRFVYPESQYLAHEEGLDGDGLLTVAVIALFHDTGFVEQYLENEIIGATNGKNYAERSSNRVLQQNGELIFNGIMTTNMVEPPKNHYEKIIRDADLSILGLSDYWLWSEKLRREAVMHQQSKLYKAALSDRLWLEQQLTFIGNHQWFTGAAIDVYEEQRLKNVELVRRKYEQLR
jgi:hypothetical protein